MKESLKSRLFRFGFNIWPCFRGTGARVDFVAADYSFIKVRIPLSWRTRNRVGTIFGGSMYASTDPFFMVQLMAILGTEFVVWDKAASIRFRKPGVDTLFVEFLIKPEQVAEIKTQVAAAGEWSFVWQVELKNKLGIVHATVDKTLYVASKEFYRKKMIAKANL